MGFNSGKINCSDLDRLVSEGVIKSFVFDAREDTPGCPYMRLQIVFLDGTSLIVIPEGKDMGGLERIGLFFSRSRV